MVMALADALHSLLRLPGATYSCVVERDSGRVLAEVGQGEAGLRGLRRSGARTRCRGGARPCAAMFDSTSGDELDDVMITGRRSYHLVRPLGTGRVRAGVPAARPEPVEPRRSPPRAGRRPARRRRGARDDPAAAAARPRGPLGSRGPRGASPSDATAPGGAVPFRRRDGPCAAGARARGPRTSLDSGPRGAPDRCVDAVGRDRSGLPAVVHRYGRVPRGGPAGCPLDRLAVVGSRSRSRSSGSPSSGSPSSGDTPAGRARPVPRVRSRCPGGRPAARRRTPDRSGSGPRQARSGPSTHRASRRRRGSRCRRSSASRGPGIRARCVASSRVSAG